MRYPVELRKKIKMMSVNQMTIYHTIMEVFKILHNKSSEQINDKYRHPLRKNTNNFFKSAWITWTQKMYWFYVLWCKNIQQSFNQNQRNTGQYHFQRTGEELDMGGDPILLNKIFILLNLYLHFIFLYFFITI